jgi:DNA adenine methylase
MKEDKDVQGIRTEAMEEMETGIKPVSTDERGCATQALFAWIGGKRQLRAELERRVPEIDLQMRARTIKHYVEVFGGMAWLLLYRRRWFENEVYNDVNGDLVNLFNVVKYHPREFYRQIRFIPDAKPIFEYYRDMKQLTDINRAVATYIKYAWSFSSNGHHFKYRQANRHGIEKKIIQLSNRLSNVLLLNESFEKIIERYDRPDAFLYLDPPYLGYEDLYEMCLPHESHIKLRDMLKATKAKWLLSYNDCPEVRELYSGWAEIEEVSTMHTAMRIENHHRAVELVIRNYVL